MPSHQETKILPYPRDQLFDLVLDIAKYPEFLPWCTAARIRERTDTQILADLAIGYKLLNETFTSQVVFKRPESISVEYKDGPFKYLRNNWKLSDAKDPVNPKNPVTQLANQPATQIEFDVDFEFRSSLLDAAFQKVFHKAVHKMVSSFEARADELYG